MKKIPYNPYIVGNPIKTKEMFFGREDDFQYVIKKLGKGKSNQILIFCGDRRSGKTSILFQILLGKLGESFLPILIDMQILAGIKSNTDFFKAIIDVACSHLNLKDFSIDSMDKKDHSSSGQDLFRNFLDVLEKKYPDKIILFLIDEYELVETKIKEGSLNENVIHFLSGVLESKHKISFIFTGSTNLENRKVDFWKSLLGKSIYRKISYLSQGDTSRLIKEPLAEYITYSDELIKSIYRLTGGQPFYTQVICQNLIDLLIEDEKVEPDIEDLKKIVKDIVNNPLPQMIYSWTNLSNLIKLVLSALSGFLSGPDERGNAQDVFNYINKNKIRLPFKREKINILLEEAYHKDFLEKNEKELYRFRMDILRRWIKKEHSIWKVTKEIGLELKKPLTFVLIGLFTAIPVLIVILIWTFLLSGSGQYNLKEHGKNRIEKIRQEDFLKDLSFISNYGPFNVIINRSITLSSSGLEDEKKIAQDLIQKGKHNFEFIYLKTGERILKDIDIKDDNQVIEISFKEAVKTTQPQDRQATEKDKLASYGSIILSSDPAEAKIIINGKDTGFKTPNLLSEIKPGKYTLSLSLEGYRNKEVQFIVRKGELLRKDIILEKTFGFFIFKIRPTALVSFKDKDKIFQIEEFTYPIETPRLKPLQIQTGEHILSIKNENLGIDEDITVTLKEGKTITIDWELTNQESLNITVD